MPPPFGDAASNAELLPSDLRQAVEKLSQLDDPVAFWNSQLVKLEQCIANFQVEEASLQSKVHPQVASVAQKFPSLAFQSLLDEYGHDDSSVADLLKGSNLIGRMGGRLSWSVNREKDESISEEELLRIGTAEQQSTWQSIRPSKDDAALLHEAEADRCKGRMLGPFFDLDEVAQALGSPRFVVQRRFPVEQEDKTRPCDDYRSSRTNEATFMSRRLRLSTLDTFFCLCIYVSQLFPHSQLKFFKRDHKSAYRQLCLAWEACKYAVVAFWDPIRCCRVAYIHLVLPFGPSASVCIYNRVSQALSFLCRAMFYLPCDSFFDDFWGVLPDHLAVPAFEVFRKINVLLGFEINIPKDVFPSSEGPILGHIANIGGKPFLAKNKPERRQKILRMILQILREHRCSPTTAGCLAGKAGHFATA